MAIADTNCNPNEMDYPIPANDDAIRAIKLVCSKIADAVIEGRSGQEAMITEEGQEDALEELLEGVESVEAAEPVVFTPDDESS